MDPNITGLIVVAGLNLLGTCLGLVFAYLTRKDMAMVEHNTNSMKDALVAATAKASLAEGTATGLQQGTEIGLALGRSDAQPPAIKIP